MSYELGTVPRGDSLKVICGTVQGTVCNGYRQVQTVTDQVHFFELGRTNIATA